MKFARIIALGLVLIAPPAARADDKKDDAKAAPAPPTGLKMVVPTAADAPAGELKDVAQKASYGIGLNIGKSMKKQAADLDPDVIARGIKDGFGGGKTLLTDAQCAEAIKTFSAQVMAQAADKVKKDGEAFLAANAKKPGVKVLPSGLQYKVLKAAAAGKSPSVADKVKVHYTGTLIDGTVFDSSVERGEPASFGVGQVIPGWTEALQKMKVGEKWQVVIPAALAYGDHPRPGGAIPPNAVLVFDVDLLGIE